MHERFLNEELALHPAMKGLKFGYGREFLALSAAAVFYPGADGGSHECGIPQGSGGSGSAGCVFYGVYEYGKLLQPGWGFQ